jgi:hypothetical protein
VPLWCRHTYGTVRYGRVYLPYFAYLPYLAYSILFDILVFGFCSSGHDNRMTTFKSAAWYALTEEELDEIVSCKDQPVLEAYIEIVFKAAVLI